MSDSIKTVMLNGVEIQENGIVRNSKGRLIARLVDDVFFEEEHVAGMDEKTMKKELQSVEEKVKEFMQIYPVSKIEELNNGCAIDVVSNLRSDVKKALTQDRTTLREALLDALEEANDVDEAKVIISEICV